MEPRGDRAAERPDDAAHRRPARHRAHLARPAPLRKERVALERAVDMALETSRPHDQRRRPPPVGAAADRAACCSTPIRRGSPRCSRTCSTTRRTTPRRRRHRAEARCRGRRGGDRASRTPASAFRRRAPRALFKPSPQLPSATDRDKRRPRHRPFAGARTSSRCTAAGSRRTATARGAAASSSSGCRSLPRRAARCRPRAPRARARSAGAPGLRVLVADDNRDAADSLQRVLQLYGYEVEVAYDGAAALRSATRVPPARGGAGHRHARRERLRRGARDAQPHGARSDAGGAHRLGPGRRPARAPWKRASTITSPSRSIPAGSPSCSPRSRSTAPRSPNPRSRRDFRDGIAAMKGSRRALA